MSPARGQKRLWGISWSSPHRAKKNFFHKHNALYINECKFYAEHFFQKNIGLIYAIQFLKASIGFVYWKNLQLKSHACLLGKCIVWILINLLHYINISNSNCDIEEKVWSCVSIRTSSQRETIKLFVMLYVSRRNRWKHCLSFQVTIVFKETSENIINYHSSKPEAVSRSPITSNQSSGESCKAWHCRRSCLLTHHRKN